jgi:hypothetical protein
MRKLILLLTFVSVLIIFSIDVISENVFVNDNKVTINETFHFRNVHNRYFLGTLTEPVILNESTFDIYADFIIMIDCHREGFRYCNFKFFYSINGVRATYRISNELMEFKFIGILTDSFICGILKTINK